MSICFSWAKNRPFVQPFKTLVDAWRGSEFPQNTLVNIGLMHSSKTMTLKSAFKSNFSSLVLHVNSVIVLGRLPVPAECNLFPRHPQ